MVHESSVELYRAAADNGALAPGLGPHRDDVSAERGDFDAARRLEALACAADASAEEAVDLTLAWQRLVGGAATVLGTFFSTSRCGLVLSQAPRPTGAELTGRRLEILQDMLGGYPQNQIAIERGLAPSTVALNARLALAQLGILEKPSRAHPLLMRLARGAKETDRRLLVASSHPKYDDERAWVIGVARPDLVLKELLPPAELSVTQDLVEGYCYEAIARRRGTAQRTVANQLGSVFRRLRVSGRTELVHRLFALAESS